MPRNRVSGDDILIGKMAPMDVAPGMGGQSRFNKRDCSTAMKTNEHIVVDNVLVSMTKEGYRFRKVGIRNICIP